MTKLNFEKDKINITINEYLSNYSKKRNLDNVFKKWFFIKDSSNPKKAKEEWDKLMNRFMTE